VVEKRAEARLEVILNDVRHLFHLAVVLAMLESGTRQVLYWR
jgi:hypothetical protein